MIPELIVGRDYIPCRRQVNWEERGGGGDVIGNAAVADHLLVLINIKNSHHRPTNGTEKIFNHNGHKGHEGLL
jgi:hypothetical protein